LADGKDVFIATKTGSLHFVDNMCSV